MYGIKTNEEVVQEKAINETGAVVRSARETHTTAEAQLTNNKNKILQYRQTIADNKMEMDILGDFEGLNSALKKKYIDLQDSTKSNERFITGAESDVAVLNHDIIMAQSKLNKAQNNYMDARTMNQDSDGLTSNEREKLSKMSMVKMSTKDKIYWADRVGGIDNLRKIIPMI